jgi:hypothetical protein
VSFRMQPSAHEFPQFLHQVLNTLTDTRITLAVA